MLDSHFHFILSHGWGEPLIKSFTETCLNPPAERHLGKLKAALEADSTTPIASRRRTASRLLRPRPGFDLSTTPAIR